MSNTSVACGAIGRWLTRHLAVCAAFGILAVSHVSGMAQTVKKDADVLILGSAWLHPATEHPSSGAWVRLPDAWNGQGRSGTWTYTLVFQLEQVPVELWSAYIPRVGNRYEARLNGHMVVQQGRADETNTDFVQYAQLIGLTGTSLRAGTNTLQLTVSGELARYAGLSHVNIGPTSALAPQQHRRLMLQNWGAFGVVVLASLLALVAGSVAWVLRDRALTIFAFACIFTAMRNLYTVVIHPPVDYRLWAWITDMSYAAVVICLVLFSMEVVRLPRRLLLPILRLFGATSLILISAYAFARWAGARQLWLTMQLAVAMTANAALILAWWRQRTRAATILGFAALVSVGFGAYDHITVFYLNDGYSSFALSRYVLPLFTVAMAAVLVDRFGQFTLREKAMRQELADELVNKTQLLEEEFDRSKTTAALLAQVHEREKLVQDLHDGMGMQLHSLLGLVERGRTDSSELTMEVRTAIEQLRSLVDSSEPFDGDVQQLFGHIRYRIESRLRRVGIDLVWSTDLPDEGAQVSPARASALQHLLFELVTNALKHSKARQIRLEALHREADGALLIRFCDDGVGFIQNDVVSGGGARSIQRRTMELDARIHVQSSPRQGTTVQIEMPLVGLHRSISP